MNRDTIFSPCRKYRYTLWRKCPVVFQFEERPWLRDYVMFIGLNPSTADEKLDDNTIRRCRAFASRWGFGHMCMTNLFAWRETDSSKMKFVENPVGQDNHHHILSVAAEAGLVVAAWGTKGILHCQDLTVGQWLRSIGVELHCIRKTKSGHPEHPLYLPANLDPIPYHA